MKRTLFIGLFLVISLSLIPLAFAGEAKKPYRVAVSLCLTGVNADFALSCKAGAEVAVEQINGRGGILGRKVELVIRDDNLDPAEAIRVLKDLHLNAKCDAYLLSPPGVCQTPQLCYAKEHNLLTFAQQGQDMYYLNDLMYPYYFIMGPTAMQEAYGFAKYVAEWEEIKSFVIFAPDYNWGHANVESFTKDIKKLKPSIKCLGHFYPPLEELEFVHIINGLSM
jgi:branched-chain amino acid transport system substrate-binding protein